MPSDLDDENILKIIIEHEDLRGVYIREIATQVNSDSY